MTLQRTDVIEATKNLFQDTLLTTVFQRQKVQSNIVKSVPKTTSVPSSSATASVGKNQSKRVLHNPNSVSNIQRQLDPLAFDPTIKKLTS